jgi:hypothetical protein
MSNDVIGTGMKQRLHLLNHHLAVIIHPVMFDLVAVGIGRFLKTIGQQRQTLSLAAMGLGQQNGRFGHHILGKR